VLDSPSDRQPFSNDEKTVHVAHDGAIFNREGIKKQLELKGHPLRTRTDAELILHLYEEFAEGCFERLRGLFAVAIWDERRGQLTLARDRLGQKPLFYTHDQGRFVFASEVKAILALDGTAAEMDYESLYHYLSLRFVPPPRTMLRGIRKLPPAHVLVYRPGALQVSRYWDLSFRKKTGLPEDALIEGAREKLQETVASHLVSDHPVGAFLSGGLDSSLIVAAMSRSLGGPFSTFSVGVDAPEFNELPYAREVSNCFGTRQFETSAKADLIELLPAMIWHLDEPSDPVAASKFLASRLASREVKVVLGGDGGDELFAGFDRYFGVGLVSRYRRVPAMVRRFLIGPLLSRIPVSLGYDSTVLKLRWIHQLSRAETDAERFAEAVCFFRFNRAAKQALLSDSAWRTVDHLSSSSLLVDQISWSDAEDSVERMMYADYMLRLSDHSLMLTDRLGMAHGVEVRSPLVDHELVEYLATFPVALKIRGRQRKYIARRIAEEELPSSVVRRKKRGFRFPLGSWFAHELHPWLRRLLLGSHFVSSGIFRRETVECILQEHRTRRADHHVRLWMLMNLELWHRIVVQRQSPSDVMEQIRDDA
jgi:asparagine synthase (glutamine-hydrolysing)